LGILNNETLSHDAVQESMIKIWDNRAKYNSTKGRLYTWMLKIVRNKTIDVQRAFNTRNFKEDSIDDANHVVHISSPSERNFNSMFVRHHVRSLKFKYQSVINALFFEELSQEEAAEKLDIPLGTVKSRKKIAIRELRKIYENEI
jgi:RNA polymerase sigma-70 factor (ECF subfamily)